MTPTEIEKLAKQAASVVSEQIVEQSNDDKLYFELTVKEAYAVLASLQTVLKMKNKGEDRVFTEITAVISRLDKQVEGYLHEKMMSRLRRTAAQVGIDIDNRK